MTVLPPAEAYRKLAPDYDQAVNPLLELERRTLPELLPPLEQAKVIDVAAGTGHWARYSVERGAHAIAADFCAEMLRRASGPRVLADARRLPFPSMFADVTICAFGLGYAPDCFSELARITRPGGMVVASDIHPRGIESGWTRSFRHEGGSISIEHRCYDPRSLRDPRLTLETIVEPYWEEGAFSHPAIFVARWLRL